jgi:hypothetical protein
MAVFRQFGHPRWSQPDQGALSGSKESEQAQQDQQG